LAGLSSRRGPSRTNRATTGQRVLRAGCEPLTILQADALGAFRRTPLVAVATASPSQPASALPHGRAVVQRVVRRIVETTRFRAKRPLVGLDIGSSELKAVQLAPAGQSYRVAGLAIEPVPPGTVIEGVVTDPAAVSAAVRRLFERAGFKAASVAVALPGKTAIVKRITLPAMTGPELDEAIRWEAEQHVPFPLADVQWHYEALDSWGSAAKTMEVLLVAARREIVEALAAVIGDAGHTPAVIDVAALALQKAHEANGATRPGATLGLLDMGAHATTVAIVVNGQPAFVRHVSMGGLAYTEALQRAFQMSFEAAEELKKKQPAEASPARAAIEAVQRPMTDTLLGEIRKTLDFFRSTTGAERIDRLVVSGGGSLLHGLTDALERRLNTPIEVLDPFRVLGTPPQHPESDHDINPRTMAVAVGLALHREDER
jgi:type IV pilus assembly protein PilM